MGHFQTVLEYIAAICLMEFHFELCIVLGMQIIQDVKLQELKKG